jgi:hypothetical protein
MTNARQGCNKILLLDWNKKKTKAMTKKIPKTRGENNKDNGYSPFIYTH